MPLPANTPVFARILHHSHSTGRIIAVRLFPLLLLSLLAVLLGACGSAGAPPSATATAQAVRANQLATQMALSLQTTREAGQVAQSIQATQAVVTATVQAAAFQGTAQALESMLSAGTEWPLVMQDDFSQDLGVWITGTQSDPLADITWKIEAGSYAWEAQANDSFVWWVTPDAGDLTDFYLAADFQQIDGPGNGECGLIFRANENNDYYLFETDAQGNFAAFLHQNDQWETLLDWQSSSTIQTQAANRLAVLARGEELAFFINGQYVDEIFDTRLPSGGVGLLVGLTDAGDRATWNMDNFELRSPAEQENTPTSQE